MSKRTLSDALGTAFGSDTDDVETPSKRRKADTPSNGTTFLDLPLEMREEIYSWIMVDMCYGPEHPYDALPGHGRFQDYLNLRLANRQLSVESKRVLERDIRPKGLIFCFNSVTSMYKLHWQLLPHYGLYDTARFHLRAIPGEPMYRAARSEIEQLILQQAGAKRRWRSLPGFYRDRPDRATMRDLAQAGVQWTLAGAGIQSINVRYKHCRCRRSPTHDQMLYRRLDFPALVGSLRLSTFIWKEPDSAGRPLRRASTVLTGKLQDLNWYDHIVTSPGAECLRRFLDSSKSCSPGTPRQDKSLDGTTDVPKIGN